MHTGETMANVFAILKGNTDVKVWGNCWSCCKLSHQQRICKKFSDRKRLKVSSTNGMWRQFIALHKSDYINSIWTRNFDWKRKIHKRIKYAYAYTYTQTQNVPLYRHIYLFHIRCFVSFFCATLNWICKMIFDFSKQFPFARRKINIEFFERGSACSVAILLERNYKRRKIRSYENCQRFSVCAYPKLYACTL